jgi:hypothetical protein
MIVDVCAFVSNHPAEKDRCFFDRSVDPRLRSPLPELKAEMDLPTFVFRPHLLKYGSIEAGTMLGKVRQV